VTLEVYRSVADFRAACDSLRARGGLLGLVPTMGALHAGHMTLVDRAKQAGATPAVTIFVNPTQFGPNEDFQAYPRPVERDLELCRDRGVWAVFLPPVAEMYPPGEKTRVRVSGLTEVLCGPRRPGHFEGVATVVAKLFAVAGPGLAVFGRKDYQQLQVIRRMVRDLLLPVEILGVETVREPDGLALSSRNGYLSEAERRTAPAIYAALSAAARRFEAGERRASALRLPVVDALEQHGFRIDYVELTGASELEPFSDEELLPERALLAVAAFLGRTRLIDNIVLGGATSFPP
jgi:pantoate--beta-alanine ligase